MATTFDDSTNCAGKEPFVREQMCSNSTTASMETIGPGQLMQDERLDRDQDPPKGLAWIMLINLVLAVNYSMLMITGFLYVERLGQSKIFYGAVVAAFPIGRLLFLMPVGLWSDKGSFKHPFAFCNLAAVIGGIMYGMASVAGSANLALLGRIVGGIGACHPVSAWGARSYPPDKRAKVESMQKSMNMVGIIAGPALNALVAHWDMAIGPKDDPIFVLNAETAAGYFPAFLGLILLIGTWRYVEEPTPNEALGDDAQQEKTWKVLLSSGAWICLLLAFQTNFQFAAIDTVLAELNQTFLGWDIVINSCVFGVIAIFCLVAVVTSIILLNKGFKCTTIIASGLMINCCASIPGMYAVRNAPEEANMTLFLTMSGLQFFAVVLCTGPTGGLFQQSCGKKQGMYGGLYLMFLAAGRPFGSMFGGLLLNGNPEYLVLSTPIFIISCLVLHLMVYKRLNDTEEQAIAAARRNGEDTNLEASMLFSSHSFDVV